MVAASTKFQSISAHRHQADDEHELQARTARFVEGGLTIPTQRTNDDSPVATKSH